MIGGLQIRNVSHWSKRLPDGMSVSLINAQAKRESVT